MDLWRDQGAAYEGVADSLEPAGPITLHSDLYKWSFSEKSQSLQRKGREGGRGFDLDEGW